MTDWTIVSTRLMTADKRQLILYCNKTGQNKADVIRAAIREYTGMKAETKREKK